MTVAVAITTRSTSPYALTKTTLTVGPDTLVYTPGTNQVLELENSTVAAITVTLLGAGASATFPVPGSGGTTINAAAGKAVIVPAAVASVPGTMRVNLDSLSAYLVGAVTMTSGTAGVYAACEQG